MRVLLLNQYGRSSGAPTGRILAELGDGLRQSGHDIIFLETDSLYGKSRRGFGRILHEIRAHALMFLRSLTCRKVDAVISLTSPACLAITADLIARIHRAKHFHWAMDIYPEVGVRLGELPEGLLTKTLSHFMTRAYRNAHRVIALDEDMREYLRANFGVDSYVMEPFPPEVTWPANTDDPRPTGGWLYSGNFGRAHEIEVLFQVQKKLENRGVNATLVLQGQGAQFASSQDAARELTIRQAEWRPPAAQESLGESLLHADVLVVTRKAEMKGLLLPSKLMLAELSGRMILWIGDTEGYTARRLTKAGHGVFGMDEVEPIAVWLQQVFEQNSRQVMPPRPTSNLREESIRQWKALLQS